MAGPTAPRTPAALSNRRIDLEGATTTVTETGAGNDNSTAVAVTARIWCVDETSATRAGSDSSQAEAVTAVLEDIERLHTVTIATADTPEPTRRASQ